jgi:hypothetical protein
MLDTVVAMLTQFGIVSGVARSAPVYALVSAGHVMGIALLLGPILLVDIRLMGGLRTLDTAAIRILRITARIGLLLALPTGALLFTAKPGEYVANPIFLIKLSVVAVGLLNAIVFEWRAHRDGLHTLLIGGGASLAFASMALWIATLLLGRWIAFA